MNDQEKKSDEVIMPNPYGMIVGLEPPRRADWAFNPADVFVCENGHLQSNVTATEREVMVARGETLKPIAFEGGTCLICPRPSAVFLTKLTNDPKELQQKLGTQMQLVAQLRAMLVPLQAGNVDNNEIALFLRNAYAHEIAEGQPQHAGSASKAVIFYLKKERGRVGVKVGQWFRALKRGLGVG